MKEIIRRNTFHARIVLIIIYLEKSSRFKFFFKIVRKLINQCLYHCEIHPDSFLSIEAVRTCRLPHPFLIIIHRNSRIGENCVIFHNVTLGAIDTKSDRTPLIGNNVYIGCNTSILGNVIIGDNVLIGAHSLILKNVESNQTVTGLYK